MTVFKEDKYRCGIYSITSTSGKTYIGSSKNIVKRWWEHKNLLGKGAHPNPVLQKAWVKYAGNLQFRQLIVCQESDLLFYEQLFIDNLKPAYNIAQIAGSPMRHRKVSEETRKKLSLAHRGKKFSDQHRMNLSKAATGRHLSDEHKTAISVSLRAKAYGY